MKPEFSEFTYGFAYIHEVVKTCNGIVTTTPTLPSLIAEKRLGYDVGVPVEGWIYFAQFKTPEFLSRASAREWHHYLTPYFRIEIGRRRDIHQHEALMRLAHSSGAYMVEYVAPRLHTRDRLDNAFATTTVMSQSLRLKVIRVTSASLRSDAQTYVTYAYTGTPTTWSEPTEIRKPHDFGDLRQPEVRADPLPLRAETFETVYSDIVSAAGERSAIMAVDEATAGFPAWTRAEMAARLLLDATLISIPKKT